MISFPLERSLLKTLALKHKSSVSKIKNRFRIGNYWGIRNHKKIIFFYKGFKYKNTVCKDYRIDLKSN